MGTSMRRASWRRRARSVGGKVIRRLGLLPGGQPDGLGEDAALASVAWQHRVMVFFADTRDSLYQIDGWYEPLRALDAEHGVVVVCMDSRTAAAVREASGLEVRTVAQDATLEGLLERSALRLCLYVNHNPLNFIPLRFRSLAHVSLLHGDSDKIVSVSNQVKAYDFAFVAGQAGADRLARYVPFFDAERHCLVIGRPQLDVAPTDAGAGRRPGSTTVLYAPTWEGAGPTVAYGSVATHGRAIVRSLVDAGHAVVYRPHPLSGVRDGAYGEADAEVRAAVVAAAEAEPGAGHRVSTGGALQRDMDAADLLICDVSAVASDWLPTTRPLLVTVPAAPTTKVAETRMLSTVPRLRAEDAATAGAVVSDQIGSDPGRQQRVELIEYYFGDVSPGAATRRFLEACTEVMRRRDAEWARVQGETDAADAT